MKEEEIIEFLAEEGFLPVVVCGGILPDYLRNGRYIFRLKKEDVESVSTRQFEDKIADFRAYVVGNIPEVCGILGSLDRSMAIGEFRGNHYEKKIFKTFIGVARIYARYLQKTKTESEVWEFFQKYVKEAEKRIRKMPEFGSSEELTEMISSMVWDYISANKQVVLTEKTMLTGEMYEALKKDIFILFDDEYYYFPPRLLMTICEPLLQTSSEPELKKHLREGGVLYCNSADYTVKKNIMTVYGTKERPRFLWVHKEFLLSPDNLRLEDIFVDNENEKEEDDNE